MKWLSHSVEDTYEVASEIAKKIGPSDTICLFGDLGAGKTTFVKGLVKSFGVAPEQVSSPTFVYLNIYQGPVSFYHFDLYRLKDEAAFLSMGFDEYLDQEGIKCIEWSEKIASILPSNVIKITLTHVNEGTRQIEKS